MRKARRNTFGEDSGFAIVLRNIVHHGFEDICLAPFRAVWQDGDNLGGAGIVDGELDILASFPNVHEAGECTGHYGGVLVSQHAIEPIDEVRLLDQMSVVVVEFSDAKGGGFSHIRVGVFEKVLEVGNSGFDKFADMDVGHCA